MINGRRRAAPKQERRPQVARQPANRVLIEFHINKKAARPTRSPSPPPPTRGRRVNWRRCPPFPAPRMRAPEATRRAAQRTGADMQPRRWRLPSKLICDDILMHPIWCPKVESAGNRLRCRRRRRLALVARLYYCASAKTSKSGTTLIPNNLPGSRLAARTGACWPEIEGRRRRRRRPRRRMRRRRRRRTGRIGPFWPSRGSRRTRPCDFGRGRVRSVSFVARTQSGL